MLLNVLENPLFYRAIYRATYWAIYRLTYRLIYRLTIIFTGVDNSIRCRIDPHHNVSWLTWIDGILGLGTAMLTTLPDDPTTGSNPQGSPEPVI